MSSLTISYVSSRVSAKLNWFFDSLKHQTDEKFPIIVVTTDMPQDVSSIEYPNENIRLTLPKPSVWQGKHRLTKEDWWAKSNAMNTAIILCQTDFIAFVDDRCVLAPTWLNAVKRAMNENYAVCGTYEKRANMKVENGVIVDEGELLGKDDRGNAFRPMHAWHGGSCALSLEWCLQVNGWPEDMCDGLGSEDSMFGYLLRNNGYPMYYDPEMKIIEDRTPGQIEGALKRADKNSHLGQQAKSWAIVRAMKDKKISGNSYDIRNMRDRILLNHEEFPPPSASDRDWFDNQPISEMT